VVSLLYQQRRLARGPKIVCIDDSTVLSMLLHSLKVHTGNLTAVVTVSGDGGSSDHQRRQLLIL